MAEVAVSVVLPVFNGSRYVGEALRSVLAQSLVPREVIVIDDGSTDDTATIVDAFAAPVKRYHQENRGLSASRNRGVELASSDLIAFIDADDLWLPEKLERQVAVLGERPEVGMIFSHLVQFLSPELSAEEKARLLIPVEKLPGVSATTCLVRASVLAETGAFDEELRVAEFVDWYARARDRGVESVLLPDVLARRRIHGGNMGIQQRDSRADYLKVLKASLDRRRSSSVQ